MELKRKIALLIKILAFGTFFILYVFKNRIIQLPDDQERVSFFLNDMKKYQRILQKIWKFEGIYYMPSNFKLNAFKCAFKFVLNAF